MRANPYDRLFYCFLSVIFGLEAYLAHKHQATGETMLYGIASASSLGLVLYLTMSRKHKPPLV